MDINEIAKYTLSRDLCVDISTLTRYPGWVRHVVFYPGNEVWVIFYGYGQDEEGYKYGCVFDNMNDAVASVEDYLGKPIHNWINCAKTGYYPDMDFDEQQKIQGAIHLLDDIMWDKVVLPKKGVFSLLSLKPTLEQYTKWRASLQKEL